VPLYEYQCRKCRRRTEKIESVSGPHLRKCPHCGASVERLLAAPAIQFKGAGWYVTDYARKKDAAAESAGTDKSDSKEASKTSKETSKETGKEPAAKESKDKKPAKKKD
jgi:putative FmdB family regulatory protein